jgi:hypothetical protein
MEVIQILKANQIHIVEILFGIFWGNQYKDWTPYDVNAEEITHPSRSGVIPYPLTL